MYGSTVCRGTIILFKLTSPTVVDNMCTISSCDIPTALVPLISIIL